MTLPEHEKLKAIQEQSQAIGEFLEWAGEKGMSLAHWTEYTMETAWDGGETVRSFVPVQRSTVDLLADYFDIDQVVLETEKRAILDEQRELNEQTKTTVAGEADSG